MCDHIMDFSVSLGRLPLSAFSAPLHFLLFRMKVEKNEQRGSMNEEWMTVVICYSVKSLTTCIFTGAKYTKWDFI